MPIAFAEAVADQCHWDFLFLKIGQNIIKARAGLYDLFNGFSTKAVDCTMDEKAGAFFLFVEPFGIVPCGDDPTLTTAFENPRKYF